MLNHDTRYRYSGTAIASIARDTYLLIDKHRGGDPKIPQSDSSFILPTLSFNKPYHALRRRWIFILGIETLAHAVYFAALQALVKMAALAEGAHDHVGGVIILGA
jgi:hypothetical protein